MAAARALVVLASAAAGLQEGASIAIGASALEGRESLEAGASSGRRLARAAASRDPRGEQGREIPWESEDYPASNSTNITGNSVTIAAWYGRLGNNIIQIVNAILFCQQSGYSTLILPPDRSQLNIFDLPEKIAIDHRTLGNHLKCDWNHLSTHYFFGRCMAVNKRLFHRTVKQYLKPYLTSSTNTACQKERARPFSGLTIHLRSGDTARTIGRTSSATQDAYASCSFFDKIVADQKFEEVRIITEPDHMHPCIKVLGNRLPSMNVSLHIGNHSIEEDACALMNARYLAVGSWSTFSQTLELLNDNLEIMFWPVPPKGTWSKLDGHCTPVLWESDRKTYVYEIAGMQDVHNNLAKRQSVEYFTRNSSQGVTLAATCNWEQEVPFSGSVSLR